EIPRMRHLDVPRLHHPLDVGDDIAERQRRAEAVPRLQVAANLRRGDVRNDRTDLDRALVRADLVERALEEFSVHHGSGGVSINHVTPPALIVTGDADPVCVPLPSCPHSFAPQHLTDCPVTAQLWCHQPAVIHVAPVIPATATGVGELAAVPSPSSPLIPSPQQRTVPFCSSAHVCAQPAATPTAFVMPLPGTGA